jgi:type IV pilus assembly protein PilQ
MRRNLLLTLLGLLLPLRSLAQTAAYCNITEIRTDQLSNGVQITVRADGVLEWQPERGDWSALYGRSNRIALRFTNAKSQIGRNFIDVSKFPVSYIQISVPQDAVEGIGVSMVVALFEPSRVNVERSNDQQSVIITVSSERTLVGRQIANRDTARAEVSAQLQVAYENGLLSIHSVKTRLYLLLAEIARKTGVNIAVDDSVRNREVSMSVDNLPVDEMIRGIASAYGLALSQVNGVYMVSDGVPTDLAPYRLSGTESFRMKFIKAQVASGLLPTFLYSYLHVNEAQNAVVVTAPTQMLEKIRADFQKIDLPPPQMMVEALAVEVASTEDLAASLGLSFTDSWITASSDSGTGDFLYRTVGTLPEDFTAKLNALEAQGKARVRANPLMAVVNGQDADIFIGQTKFIKVEVTSFGGKQERIQGVDVDVKLSVRPWTGGNGEITLTLEPEVSNISELDRETGMPVLSTRRAQTTVRVKDGETIVIGGLTQQQEYKTRTKIPLLGDLPVLGTLFRGTKTSRINSELLIFVTPHILTDTGRLKDAAEEQRLRERMLPKTP